MTTPRGLSADEAAAWARLAATVDPMFGKESPPLGEGDHARRGGGGLARHRGVAPPPSAATRLPPPPEGEDRFGLDSHWERRLRAGTLAPDFTLDLHDHSLDAAYQRLLGGLDLAREAGARMVLVIAGRERPGPAADRSGQRGAIRAKLLDWLAASRHFPVIAAIRKAHRRHGGDGALYVILKRPR
ncbi:MAG: Smr/MutS family protein [Qipengyuania sp.]|nr:Smr/MutS family protein [Qipengyuania sp.]